MTKYKYYSDNIKTLKNNEVFVFGSNLAGRHGKGAAWTAMRKFGASYGTGCGFTGKCYALPTKDHDIRTLVLSEIIQHIEVFKNCQLVEPDLVYFITKVGCGLAGYKDSEIAPLFKGCDYRNTVFHIDWMEYLE